LLVLLAYRGLKGHMKTAWIYPVIFLYAFFIGFLDELIQGLLPNRFYEFKDVTINWISSLLATGILAGCTLQDFIGERSLRKYRRWSLAVIVIMLTGYGIFFYQRYWNHP
jgi:hypothetical protein